MLRYLAIGFVVTGSLIGFQLYSKQSEDNPTLAIAPIANDSVAPSTAVLKNNATGKPSAFTQPKQNAVQPKSANNSNDLSDDFPSAGSPNTNLTVQKRELWQEDDSLPETPIRYANKGIDARPLTINKKQIANIGVGDTVPVPLPQTSQDYEMAVKEVGRHANGDKSLKGHLVSNPDYTVVMTEGQSATFATINTPEGSFLLEADGTQGWVMSQTDLDLMADPNLVDYQIPDIAR